MGGGGGGGEKLPRLFLFATNYHGLVLLSTAERERRKAFTHSVPSVCENRTQRPVPVISVPLPDRAEAARDKHRHCPRCQRLRVTFYCRLPSLYQAGPEMVLQRRVLSEGRQPF